MLECLWLQPSVASYPGHEGRRKIGNEARLQWVDKKGSCRVCHLALPPQVLECMFNALLAWATTRDVRYLLAAQRSLTTVQNQEGDT